MTYGLGKGQYPSLYLGGLVWALDWMQARAVTYTPIVLGAAWRFLRDAWRSACEDARLIAEVVTGYRWRRKRLARRLAMQQWHGDWTLDRGALRAATNPEGYELSRRVIEP